MKCKQCLTERAAADFYASNKTRCKLCVCASVKKHRQENLEAIRAYDRMRGSQAHRVAAREVYRVTTAYAKSHKAAAKRWEAKHPERKRAQQMVNNSIRDGKLVPWPVCEVPECSRKPHAHHPDYSMPLLVTWLCPAHHKETHAITKEAA
jgi:hypothetical protein